MMPALLDAGPIVALLDRTDKDHLRCAKLLADFEAPLVTCEAVITEACYLLRDVRNGPTWVLENIERGVFLVSHRITERAGFLSRLIKKYADVPMDLADACLVDMASETGCGRILTLDDDFRVYRWGRNRPFELLLQKR